MVEKSCPVTATLQVIGGKWKSVILWQLRDQTYRFGELKKQIPNISQKMLSQQLRELEQDGLVVRKVYAEIPPKVEYSLTELGVTLCPVLEAMCHWGKVYGSRENPIDVEREAKS